MTTAVPREGSNLGVIGTIPEIYNRTKHCCAEQFENLEVHKKSLGSDQWKRHQNLFCAYYCNSFLYQRCLYFFGDGDSRWFQLWQNQEKVNQAKHVVKISQLIGVMAWYILLLLLLGVYSTGFVFYPLIFANLNKVFDIYFSPTLWWPARTR